MAFRTPARANETGARLVLTFYVPEVSLKALKSITLSIKIGDQSLAPATLSVAGKHELSREVPDSVLRNQLTQVEFSLDKFRNKDGVENGIIVSYVGMESK